MECLTTTTTETDDWRVEIKKLMSKQDSGETIHPVDAKKIVRYILIGGDLYGRGFSTPLLKCLFGQESQYVLDELHNRICGFHTGCRTLKA